MSTTNLFNGINNLGQSTQINVTVAPMMTLPVGLGIGGNAWLSFAQFSSPAVMTTAAGAGTERVESDFTAANAQAGYAGYLNVLVDAAEPQASLMQTFPPLTVPMDSALTSVLKWKTKKAALIDQALALLFWAVMLEGSKFRSKGRIQATLPMTFSLPNSLNSIAKQRSKPRLVYSELTRCRIML
ncbi:MAG: hypothetical protein ACFCBU_17180 [Cyanophyceae cyanobacterium]